MLLGDLDSKTGDIIKEILKSKHLEGRDVSVEKLPEFDSCPEMINIVVTEANIKKGSKKAFWFCRSIGNRLLVDVSLAPAIW